MASQLSSSRPRWSSAAGAGAALLILVGMLLIVLFVRALGIAFQTQSVAEFVNDLTNSAWAKVTLLDYVVGSFFAASWIATRHTGPLLGLPNIAWAVLLPMLGNPLLYIYVLLTVFRTHSVCDLFQVPVGVGPNDASDCEDTPQKSRLAWWYGAAFGSLALVYFLVLVYAVLTENVSTAFLTYFTEKSLMRATFYDVFLGVLFSATLIIYREGITCSTLIWLAALALFGNGVSCLYAISIARDASILNTTLGESFSTQRFFARNQYI